LALAVPAGPSPDGTGGPVPKAEQPGNTNSKPNGCLQLRRPPMLQLQTNDLPVVDSKLFTGVRNGLLIEAGVVALILLLYWLF
jgi:hypothetical protein